MIISLSCVLLEMFSVVGLVIGLCNIVCNSVFDSFSVMFVISVIVLCGISLKVSRICCRFMCVGLNGYVG